ncbi:MAG: hypothetical protein IJN85_04385 [Oscillospiraceae bacterium]|nr:hypothetical protein [Oscillospiraceae bacterium]
MDNMNNNFNQMPVQQNGGAGLGVASMVLGILSFVVCFLVGYVNIACAILAVILGAIAVKKGGKGKGMGIAGLVLGIVNLAIYLLAIIALESFFQSLGLSMF